MLNASQLANALAVLLAETAIERDRQAAAARELGAALNDIRAERDALQQRLDDQQVLDELRDADE